ncbi:hypothetical protein DPV78_000172 [Talaromyces pinophilus]|jgi:hypothetical protein|nr:hypothetical protein DPV78_000172 [Talaromyces pinophilus]
MLYNVPYLGNLKLQISGVDVFVKETATDQFRGPEMIVLRVRRCWSLLTLEGRDWGCGLVGAE